MIDRADAKPCLIDWDRLPALFPTHLHPAEFWENLGRAVATFGYLEETLAKAIFAFTATTRYPPEKAEAAYAAWLPKLEHALYDTLHNLADAYGKAVRENKDAKIDGIDDLVNRIKNVAGLRNMLCHGSWRVPGADGRCEVFYFNKRMECFSDGIDHQWLREMRAHTLELACHVIDSVTIMGWQFPGVSGPGKPIWSRQS